MKKTGEIFSSWLRLSMLMAVGVSLVLGSMVLAQKGATGIDELRVKRKKLLEEIEQTNQLIRRISEDKQAIYDKYKAIEAQIKNRQELINVLEKEIEFLNKNIERTSVVINSLNEDIDRLKDEYNSLLRHAYRQRLTGSRPLFLLSAQSFNELFKRWQYLRQYDQYRRKQLALIVETQQQLQQKIYVLEQKRSDKAHLLSSYKTQSEILSLDLQTKNRLLDDLKKDEERAKQLLRQKEIDAKKLENAIAEIIKRETDAPVETKRETPSPSASNEGISLTQAFRRSEGRLPWPVDRGIITERFGVHNHPTFSNLVIQSNGIDISTDPDAPVKAIFEGEVVGIQYVPGSQYMVIVRHGDYFTVYSNLKETTVQRGDRVKSGQRLGTSATDPQTNSTEMSLQIWHNKTRLDPEKWLRPR